MVLPDFQSPNSKKNHDSPCEVILAEVINFPVTIVYENIVNNPRRSCNVKIS